MESTKYPRSTTRHVINTTEDGFSNIVEVLPADPVTGMVGIQFCTEWTEAEHPHKQVKHQFFVTPAQFLEMSNFLSHSAYLKGCGL